MTGDAARDTLTLLRRRLRHLRSYPSLTLFLVGIPVVFLLLFVDVFGGILARGLAGLTTGTGGGRSGYATYVTPAIILLTVASASTATAMSVASDMTEGIVDRFRTMAIWRPAILTAHVAGAMIQTLIAVALVIAVAFAVGFRPHAGPLDWLAGVGVLAMVNLALTWLGVALGMAAKSVQSASNTPMFLLLLPFLGSGFVPPASMPVGLRQFAAYQPFTAFTDTLRALWTGGRVGDHAAVTLAWCVGITTVGFVCALTRYHRGPAAAPAAP